MLHHTGTVPIETERLLLRRFTLDDDKAMYANWANDDEVTRYLYWPTHAGVDVSRKVLEDWVASYEKHDYYQWAIVPKASADESSGGTRSVTDSRVLELPQGGSSALAWTLGAPIGSIAAVAVRDRDENCEIGYCIGRAWWGKGIMTEALRAVMDHFFAMGMERVAAMHIAENPASGKVMVKCGMKLEGVMRRAHKNKWGGFSDLTVYGAVREER